MSYGSDSWNDGTRRTGRMARGATVVIQALFRRGITPRGTLRGGEEELNYGFDISGYIGAVGDDVALRSLPGQLRQEYMKDDRVLEVEIIPSIYTDAAKQTSIDLAVTGILADSEEPFAFTIRANSVTVELLGGARTP